MHVLGLSVALVMLACGPIRADEPGDATPRRLRAAVERALAPIQHSLKTYPARRDCFSCHNQAMPTLALALARSRGFDVDPEALDAALDVTLADLGTAEESYREGEGQGGGATRAGYALWTLDLLDHPPDSTTEAVAGFLLDRDRRRGHWQTSSNRPPSEASPFTTTFVALRGSAGFAVESRRDDLNARRADALEWLLQARPRETEDRVFRLLGLGLAGADSEVLRDAARELLDAQNADGGWSQLPGRPSDAYATGSALTALRLTGSIDAEDPAFRRGLCYLLDEQRPDGTWYVESRSKPFQPYFESGFPYGADQFISIASSSWATSALVLGLPGDAGERVLGGVRTARR
jgi:hypothetical protein